MKNLFILAIIIGLIVSCGTENNPLNSDNEARDKTTQVVEVQNPITGRIWMDRNLGASRAASDSWDDEAYGDLYQWGRGADGHQKRNSPIDENLSQTITPGHGNFIIVPGGGYDWLSTPNSLLWQPDSEINNPCPNRFRIPTKEEWQEELRSWGDYGENVLKLTLARFRHESDGRLNSGSSGRYWTSNSATYLDFDRSKQYFETRNKATGHSVRCIKD